MRIQDERKTYNMDPTLNEKLKQINMQDEPKQRGINAIINRKTQEKEIKDFYKYDQALKYREQTRIEEQNTTGHPDGSIPKDTFFEAETEILGPAEGNPKVMDVTLVYKMFTELKQEFTKTNIIDGTERIEAIENRQELQAQKLVQISENLLQSQTKEDLLTGFMANLSSKINELDRRVENLELNYMKRSVVLTGLNMEPSKANFIKEVKHLFQKEMQVTITKLEDVFFLTRRSTSPAVITFQTLADKIEVMKNSKKLNELENYDGKPIYLNDYLPPALNEKKKREAEIYHDNAKEVNELDMVKKGGRLWIENQPYKKMIETPRVEDLITLSAQQVEQALCTPIVKGQQIDEMENSFIGFMAKATTYEEIKKLYVKMKLSFADARHIVCAYRIPGSRSFECEDYCDDGEHNMGNSLLKWMKSEDIKSTVLFVTRYTSQNKIGPQGYQLYQEAAKSAWKKINPNATQNLLATPLSDYQKQGHNLNIDDETSSTTSEPWQIQKRHRRRPDNLSLSQKRGLMRRRGVARAYPTDRWQNNNKSKKENQYNKDPTEQFSFEDPTNVLDENEWPQLTIKATPKNTKRHNRTINSV